jgi:hypothetical protein
MHVARTFIAHAMPSLFPLSAGETFLVIKQTLAQVLSITLINKQRSDALVPNRPIKIVILTHVTLLQRKCTFLELNVSALAAETVTRKQP